MSRERTNGSNVVRFRHRERVEMTEIEALREQVFQLSKMVEAQVDDLADVRNRLRALEGNTQSD